MESVADTTELFSASSMISFLKGRDFMKLRKIAENISMRISSELSGTFMILKCLEKRGVRAERPPPGGAEAAINTVDSISLVVRVLRS